MVKNDTPGQQSPLAPELVELFKSELLANTDYINRVKRHYKLFRQRIERKVKAE